MTSFRLPTIPVAWLRQHEIVLINVTWRAPYFANVQLWATQERFWPARLAPPCLDISPLRTRRHSEATSGLAGFSTYLQTLRPDSQAIDIRINEYLQPTAGDSQCHCDCIDTR